MCWGVWKERNNRIFREKETKAGIVFHKFLNAMIENYTDIKGSNPFLSIEGRDKNMRVDCR